MEQKNFIPRNEGFTCEICKKDVLPARSTSRNHCPYCLTSKHVDDKIPGDRASSCGGLMPAVGVEGVDPAKLDLVHECQRCGKIQRNKIAIDDNFDAILAINK
ncbi:MAG: RNHCP domain-containing protein [Candidatus Andersenbacteria bacterium]|nr:RNHCP domain-containing protein [Candidatus Andersenbacteria bacterium]MBI3251179.1 RNHCP domain-containing protein [Candidatus Andersenbacteria bacterium]